MTGTDYAVPPRSWAAIDQIGENLRARFDLASEPRFPIFEFLEQVLDYRMELISFRLGDRAEMGLAEGYTHPQGEFIQIREDVYLEGLRGQGRARFTAAHELGHLVMHTNIPLARARPDTKAYSRAEPQANQFASALLMPLRFLQVHDTPEIVAERHGVSKESARLRLEYMRKRS